MAPSTITQAIAAPGQVMLPNSAAPVNAGVTPSSTGEAPTIVVNSRGKVVSKDPADKKPATRKEFAKMQEILKEGDVAAQMIKQNAIADISATI